MPPIIDCVHWTVLFHHRRTVSLQISVLRLSIRFSMFRTDSENRQCIIGIRQIISGDEVKLRHGLAHLTHVESYWQ